MKPALIKTLLPARLRSKLWPDRTSRRASASKQACPDDEAANFGSRPENSPALRRELAIQISTALALHGYMPQSTAHAHITADGLHVREMKTGIFTRAPLDQAAERAAFEAYVSTLSRAVEADRISEITRVGDMVLNLPTLSRHDQMAALSRSTAIALS